MKTFLLLVLSGVVWLGAIRLSGEVDLPPQLISLARSGYIGTFSIFVLLELRREAAGRTSGKYRPQALYLYLTPVLSVAILALYSQQFPFTIRILVIMSAFYLAQFVILLVRSRAGHIRRAEWDLLAPLLLIGLSLSDLTLAAAVIFGLGGLVWMFSLPRDQSRSDLDAVIVQLPSLCLAPIVLIAIRDSVDFGNAFSRADVETFGLIVNGVGAALWMSLVLRASNHMKGLSIALWLASALGSILLFAIGPGVLGSFLTIVVAEGFRGALWLGTTYLLWISTRWHGLTINLIATSVPLFALWLGRSLVPPHAIMLIYGTCLVLMPAALLGRSCFAQRIPAKQI